jgi:pimeloyl-ACP methyl ester carboxylesterase
MDVVELDGLQIAYECVGSGSALVLLHGYVGDGPTTWRPQLDGLSDEFTVVAWDAPGAGRSTDPPPERFGIDGYADCLAGFLERLRLDTAYVAGLSFGGIVALALQRRHFARSSALILASAYAGWAGSLPPEVTEGRLRQALALADGAPEAFVGTSRPSRTCCSRRSARPPATSCSRGRAAGRSPTPSSRASTSRGGSGPWIEDRAEARRFAAAAGRSWRPLSTRARCALGLASRRLVPAMGRKEAP